MDKKIAYLNHIEDNTVYPAYRKAVKFLNYIWAILIMVTAGGSIFLGSLELKSQQTITGAGTILGGILLSLIFYFLSRVANEVSLVLVDIGDSIIDANSKNFHPNQETREGTEKVVESSKT
ncbi:hypothetical protein N9Z15_05775 [Akkermansiaceae bacterium]|nr:hypothetical protein [Akkermansiaceae bacterium]MDB4321747.1 hypothetical protein [Akkermansiaceae bacterium]MDB4382081.1 hypothetical protein [Akkermansiaceae bacterium]MDB4387692.1 hypothetical protein [Akkermansiaceae bacterium]